jgi:hypothetical protein
MHRVVIKNESVTNRCFRALESVSRNALIKEMSAEEINKRMQTSDVQFLKKNTLIVNMSFFFKYKRVCIQRKISQFEIS